MNVRIAALAALVYSSLSGPSAASQPIAPYTAVEVDVFIPDRGVALPPGYQNRFADEIAREISLEFPAVIIFRETQTPPGGQGVLRISGTITRFIPVSKTKGVLFGFGAGSAILRTQVRFGDATTGRVLLIHKIDGVDAKAADSIARKIAKLCNSARLLHSN
jgi:hypothetical protein